MKRARGPAPVAVHRALIRLLLIVACGTPGWAQPSPEMSFFVTSVGNGASGGDYGGLAGADVRCQQLAGAAGAAPAVWRAYLSTVPIDGFGGVLVHARDRIGTGPWRNYDGTQVAADLQQLHLSGIAPPLILTETGELVPSAEHDVLTGTRPDGTAMDEFPFNPSAPAPTCFNWTSSVEGTWGFVGHADWEPGDSWSSSHETQCHEAGLAATAGSGRLYCFALAGETPIFADGFESGDVSRWGPSP